MHLANYPFRYHGAVPQELNANGSQTLLIDADMRHPSINHLFDQPHTPGLCEILRGEATIEDCIVPSSIPDLSISS